MTTTAVRRAGPRIRLDRRARRLALAVHLWTAGAWLGLDLALGALVVTALGTDDPGRRAACLQLLEALAIWPLAVVGLGCLASGVLLGLGTSYGLLRYRWVAIKLVINVVLSVLVLVLLGPNTRTFADQGRALAAGAEVHLDTSSLVMPPVVTLVALTFAVYLSVWKPWGRLRRVSGGTGG